MLTYPALGKNGRIGNCLFQIAATAGAAWTMGEDFVLPSSALVACPSLARFPSLRPHFRDVLPDGEEYRESRYSHDPVPSSSVRLHGYFQSAKYWKGHESRVCDLLRPSWTCDKDVPPVQDCVAVHVRRGDYAGLGEYHTNLGVIYYGRAMDWMRAKGCNVFLVFSDDPSWCVEFFRGMDVRVQPTGDPVDDMIRFSSCGAHVIANSSWSWWGAYLGASTGANPVVAPKDWFGPKGPPAWRDVYCPDWIVL